MKYKQPTQEQIVAYLQKNGYPYPLETDKWMVEEFAIPANWNRREQYWQAVAENIALCDFDRWQYFQKVIGYDLRWEAYRKIDEVFYEEDIEILEMPCKSKIIW